MRISDRAGHRARSARDRVCPAHVAARPGSFASLRRGQRVNTATAGEVLADTGNAPEGRQSAGAGRRDQLVLSTMRSAKGLEWTAVFVIQALDGCVPMIRDPFDEDPDDDKLDEELRIADRVDLGRDPVRLSDDVLVRLRDHDFPGNVRELSRVPEQALGSRSEGPLSPQDLALP